MTEGPWSLRLLTWNIHKCKGVDGRTDPARILNVIRDSAPDAAVLQEADERFGMRRGMLSTDDVQRTCGLRLVRSSGAHPRSIGWHGNVLLLRPDIELESMSSVSLPSLEPRGAVIWRLRRGGRRVVVIGVHLGLVGRWRALQAREVARIAGMEGDVAIIIAGDMNEWRRKGRSLAAIENQPGFVAVGGPSFPSRRPILPLDRIAAGGGASISSWKVVESGSASDHRPLLACVNC